jgi:O-antigen/teichoic acid export membrane protein
VSDLKELKRRTLRGGFAKVCAQAANFILRIGALMVLARLLDPKDFGLVGMVTAVTGVFSLFKDAGLTTVTIQRDSITNEQISTLFWVNLLIGAVLSLLSLGLSPILANFYQEPHLFWLTAVVGTGFLLNSAGVQHSALLQRQMRFVTLAIIEVICFAVSAGVGIGMALTGFGYWSLVAMAIIFPATFTICVWLSTKWVPGIPHRNVGMRSMLSFGGKATLNSLLVYFAYNIDKILMGRFWGAEALGIYGRAYQLVNIPTENINAATGGVALSALSRLKDDPVRFKRYFLSGYSLVLSITLPITLACTLFAEDIILILLGPKWHEAVIIFQLLAPTIIVFGLINPLGWVVFSLGMIERSLKIALVLSPLLILACVLGLPYGTNGVAFAFSAAMILWLVPHIVWCVNGTPISVYDVLRVVRQPLISVTGAVSLTYIAQSLFVDSMAPLPRLILGSSILVLVYLWILLYVMGQKAFYLNVLRGLKGESTLMKVSG